MRMRNDFHALTGPEKAAILMLAIGDERAARLFARMEESEIKELAQAMATLGTVSAAVVERLLADFAGQVAATGPLVGSYATAKRFLAKVLDQSRAEAIMAEIRSGGAAPGMWTELGAIDDQVLANYLRNEYPQTVAVVLSRLKADRAGRVLAQLPESFAVEVIMRMLRMQPVHTDVLADVERTLRSEFFAAAPPVPADDAHALVAAIFNSLDHATETRFLAAIEERDHAAAERVAQAMFTFEDLAKLDGRAIQQILRNADRDRVPLALKGASHAQRELFLRNMSERAGKLMREEIDGMGPVRLRDIEEAQEHLVSLARDLAQRGEIVIAPDDELVY